MSNIPSDLKYAKSHEWVRVSGGVATENIHLPQAVLRGDIALREDEIV